MSNGVKYFVTFVLGATVGSVVAWRVLKSAYAKAAKDEIEEVREYYRQKMFSDDCEQGEDNPAEVESETDYETIVSSLYTNTEGGSEMAHDENPFVTVITPEEFVADDEYQAESLTLYACGTLTDDFDNPIEDVDSMVGNALDYFGEYEDDTVFVRNDRYKCNYEICKDVRTYEEVRNRLLNLVDDDE